MCLNRGFSITIGSRLLLIVMAKMLSRLLENGEMLNLLWFVGSPIELGHVLTIL